MIRKLNLWGIINILMHLVDMISDLLYVLKVPKYNQAYSYSILLFMILPFLVTILIVKCLKMKGCCANISMVCMIMLNIVGQIPLNESSQDAVEMLYLMPKVIFLICEDAP